MTITNKVSLKSVMGGNTPVPDVPDGAVVGAVTDAYDGTATVAATAAVTGGTPTTYTITPTPTTSPATFTGTSPITVSGLSDGTAYTFTAKGVNSTATGPAGSSSSSFTPNLAGSFYSIATTTLSTTAGSVTFSSIPSTYTHLQIRYMNLASVSVTDVKLQFNSDAGSNYTQHLLWGNGTSPFSSAYASTTYIAGGVTSNTTSNPAANIVDILDYKNTNKYTTVRTLAGSDTNGVGGFIFLESGVWMNTAAVTSITLTPSSGTFNQYSSFALYGVIA